MHEPGREALVQRGVTRRELDVLDAVARRLTNAEIAALLCLSERTVETHVSSLLHKLDARNRLELIGWAAPHVPSRSFAGTLPYQLDAIAGRGPCVGRDDERARLLACWERTMAGTTVAIVRGDAGIGKSRLAAEVAVEVHRRGGLVALGSCTDGPQRPYEPFMAAIESDIARLSDDELRRRLQRNTAIFVRLSPEVATRLDGEARPGEPDLEREQESISALVEYLSAAAQVNQLLVVIEDLHWASVATRAVVAHIARFGGDVPLMLLVTTRDQPPFLDDGLVEFFGQITRLLPVELVALSGLGVDAAARVIDAVGGELDPEVGVRQTGGNPLFLQELARHGSGSRSLVELVADRFNRLSTDDLAVLDTAAVAGEQLDVPLLASALERPVDQVLDALERAEAVGLIGPGSRPGRFAFIHDVYRSVRYESLTAGRRFRLHASLADALHMRQPAGQASADLARHACLAGPRFDPSIAAQLARQAGDAAADATDHGEAAAHYRRALDALDLVPGPEEAARLDLDIRLGASLRLLGDERGLTMLQGAAHTAQQRRDPVSLARAVCAMESSLGGTRALGYVDEAFTSLAEAALDTLPPSEEAWRIRVSTILGLQVFGTAPARGTAIIRDAVAAARRLGDPVTLGRVLLTYRFCGGPLDSEQRMACGHELVELGELTGLEIFAYGGRQQLCWSHRELGNRDEMDYWFHATDDYVHGRDIEQLSHAASVALMEGDLARAEQLTDLIDETCTGPGSAGFFYVATLRGALRDWREQRTDLMAVERLLAAGTLAYPDVVESWLARNWARRGRHSRAQELLDRARSVGFPPMYSGRGGATPVGFWAETAAVVADDAAAHELSMLLDPLAGRFVDSGSVVFDTVDRLRALLRLITGDAPFAAELAAGAAAASRRRRTPVFLGRELVILAAAQQQLGVDRPTIAGAIDEAFDIARRTGTRMITHDAALFLPGFTDGSQPDGSSELTAREQEVIDLVAAGATNAQIAATLQISPATVRKHLEHAFRKLEVSTRGAAAAKRALRHRDPDDRGSGAIDGAVRFSQ